MKPWVVMRRRIDETVGGEIIQRSLAIHEAGEMVNDKNKKGDHRWIYFCHT